MSDIKILCDSLSDITQEYIDKYDIGLMPISVMIDDNVYRDRVDLDIDEFYRVLREDRKVPKTSQVTYGQFCETFEKYLKEGKQIIYIAAAATATGTYQTALMAKNDVDTDDNIRIIDSNTLCFGISMLVLKACELREQGLGVDDIVKGVEEFKDKVYVCFSCDDLEYLCKGGRISNTKAIIGTVLGIKPICVIKNGLVDNVANARGKKNLINKLIDVAKENGVEDMSGQTVYVGYSDDIKERDRLVSRIQEEYNPKEIKTFIIGSGIGTHGGPGTTGFICVKSKKQ